MRTGWALSPAQEGKAKSWTFGRKNCFCNAASSATAGTVLLGLEILGAFPTL